MKPILFNSEMVRAILDGRKTVTRRIVKAPVLSQVNEDPNRVEWCDSIQGRVVRFTWHGKAVGGFEIKPPYHKGDILYVRETWTVLCYVDEYGYTHYDKEMYYYAADGEPDITLYDPDGFKQDDQRIRWRPSIHMPKEAARIFLRVTDVRAERLQSITEVDAQQEGAGRIQIAREVWSYRRGFRKIWDNTVKPADLPRYSWDANPWVWVIEFERCEKPEEKP